MIEFLREALLDALEDNSNCLIYNTIRAIQHSLNCEMCTLWSINHNTTRPNATPFDSASLLARIMSQGMNYPYINKDDDFAHSLDHCFIKHALDIINYSGSNYLECTIDDCTMHLSYKALKEMGFTYFICIPIIQNKVTIAFLKLAYFENPHMEEELPRISNVINKAVFSAINRHIINQKQSLINDLIKNYRSNGNKDLKDLFEPVIVTIFKKYFEYEGASIFIWDSYSNQYNLLVTTGLKDILETDEVFYLAGEGLTGIAASKKEAIIYDNLKDLEANNPEHLHKYREDTENEGKTLLSVPIYRPSNQKKVFGIVRFTNKINGQSLLENRHVVDFFNINDIELIQDALHYLALNIDNYLEEEERMNFISKMSHESRTPANAIRVSAYRIQKKMADDRFMRSQFQHYIQSIIDYADLQLMQASTNLFISKSNRNYKKKSRYVNTVCSIGEIIKASINVIRPFAREHKVTFDNIVIRTRLPNRDLLIDKSAFLIVFYNLLTNAIKYIKRDSDLSVEISAEETRNSLVIRVQDYGIGIKQEDLDRIFYLGYRGVHAQKTNAEGYGIGLYVVKQILDDYNCHISITSNLNPTTFEIEIPNSLFVEKKR